ncbi:hypothetical protein HDU67_008765 [Dinochytrium kinnereticum]|nr:hypothetical protein HDU67_008765 [Dinochytrium kinnereticum]
MAGCNKSFANAAQLTAHQKFHERPHEFRCQYPECGKVFPQVKSLMVHCRIHTGDRPYVCPVPDCGKSFRQASGLRSHNFTHTGERPYVCRACGKSYTTSSRLKIHIRNHTDEYPYKCEFEGCTKAFKQSSNLRQHEQTHIPRSDRVVTVRGLACGFCGNAYKTSDSLEQHIRRSHPGKTLLESNSIASAQGLPTMTGGGADGNVRGLVMGDVVPLARAREEDGDDGRDGKRVKVEDDDDDGGEGGVFMMEGGEFGRLMGLDVGRVSDLRCGGKEGECTPNVGRGLVGGVVAFTPPTSTHSSLSPPTVGSGREKVGSRLAAALESPDFGDLMDERGGLMGVEMEGVVRAS